MKGATPWRHAWYVGTVVALIAAIAVPSWLAVDARDRAIAREAVEDRDEHVLMYELAPTSPAPRLPLLGTEQAIYLGTLARWPSDLDANAVTDYEIEVSIRGAGTPWTRTIAFRTRQATDDDVRLNATPTTPLGDERDVIVTLPAVEAGAVVTLRATRGASLVRVLSLEPRRSPGEHGAKVTTDAAARLLRDVTLEPWSMLPEADRLALVSTVRRKVSPLGEDGVDYRAHGVRVRRRATRPPALTPAVAPPGFDVEPERAYALNLLGPARLHVQPFARGDVPDATARNADELAVTIDALDTETGMHTFHQIDGLGADLDLPAGLHGLTITTLAHDVGVAVTAPATAVIGAQAEECAQHNPDACDVRPDIVRLPVELTGPGLAPLELRSSLDVVRDGAADLVRVNVRALDVMADGTPTEVELGMRFLDMDDVLLGEWREALAFVDDPFATYVAEPAAPRRVSAPRSLTVTAPPGTARIAVTTSAPVALRPERWLGDAEVLAPPYAELAPGVARWRVAPRVVPRWVGFWSDAGRPPLLERYVAATVRLAEPSDSAPAVGREPDTAARSLAPAGTWPQRIVREPVEATRRAAVRTAWPSGAVTVLRLDRPVRVRVPTAASGPSHLYYEVEPAAVGAELTLEIDGEPPLRVRLDATRGGITLPALAAGEHTVTARAAVPVMLTIDRAPVDAREPIQRRRVVFALDQAPMPVRVRTAPGERIAVNVVVYGPPSLDGQPLRYTIDGGRTRPVPGVVEGALTVTDRTLRLPRAGAVPDAAFVDARGEDAGRARTFSIPLGPDLGAGSHEIKLHPVRGQRLWVRFFVYTFRDASRSAVLQHGVVADDDAPP